MKHIQKAFAQGSDVFEWIHCKRDGTPFPAHVSLSAIRLGEKKQLLAILTDLTDVKQAEEELRETKAILQTAMDSSQAAIAIADAPDGKLRYVNKAGLLLSGKTEAELVKDVDINKYISSWQIRHLDGTEYKAEELPLARAIIIGETCSDEFILRRQDGEDRIVWANAAPIYDDEGNVKCGIVVFLDITEKKNLEKELVKSQKLEATATLAEGIAHDFNNLLAVITGYIELVLDDLGMDHENTKGLNQALDASRRAQDLTSKFITFSTGGTPIKIKSSIKELLVESIDEVLSEENYSVELSLGENIWHVEMDTRHMIQVINNVLINAKESMKLGGKVKISAENISSLADESIVAETLFAKEFVKIVITDQGEGIPSQIMQNIFDPYFSTKERGAQKGMGLGLTVALSIVKQHDGYIVIKSEKNGGTSVYIYLPAVA
jgi:PAS domain S-box-containing protein